MKFLKILSTVLVTILLLEISLRILRPTALEYYWVQKQIHKTDPEYLVDLEPNLQVRIKHFQERFDIQFSTNEYGFRATDKIDNSLPQIVCIGDSVTMGFGVSDKDTFCKKLDGYTDQKGQKYQVVNLAVDAYGPTAISRKLRKQIPLLNAKYLYYFPSTGDDIDEVNFAEKFKAPLKMKFFEYQFQLTKISYLFLAIKISLEQIQIRFMETIIYPLKRTKHLLLCMTKKNPKSICEISTISELIEDFNKDFFVPKYKDPNDPPIFGPDECKELDGPLPIPDNAYRAIDDIIDYAKERNMVLVMFLLPIDIESAYCSQRGKKHHFYHYLTDMKPYFQKKGVDFIDMNQKEHTSKMIDSKGRINARPYYIIGDGHYTKMGNEWVYKEVLRKTKEIIP